jgi:hypothetical protein
MSRAKAYAYLVERCESIDASVFSGDLLWSKERRGTLKEYVERWQRAIAEHEKLCPDDEENA